MDKLGKTLSQLIHDVYGTDATARIINVHGDTLEFEARVVTVCISRMLSSGHETIIMSDPNDCFLMHYIPAKDLLALYSCKNMYNNFVSLAKEAGSLTQWETLFATAYVATGRDDD